MRQRFSNALHATICCLLALAIVSPIVAAPARIDAKLKLAAKKIDLAVKKGLIKKKLRPNPKINDLQFLRRIYLDTIGRIPNHAEFKMWQDQRRRDRAGLIQDLINRPAYASHQFNYWTDALRAKSRDNGNGENYLNYIRHALSTNMPYDKFVYNMIASGGNPNALGNGAVGYYFRDRNMPLDNISITTQLFLATDMSCSQCHDDPFSDWTQMDFYQLSAFTNGMRWRAGGHNFRKHPRMKEVQEDDNKRGLLRDLNDVLVNQVVGSGTGTANLPRDYKYDDAKPRELVKARAIYGTQPKVGEGKNAKSRQVFARWLTSKDNPMFTKTIVNRMWHKIMGATLIGPLTELEMEDTGMNPELTNVLVQIMKDVNYDLRKFEQIIFMTSTYQSEMTLKDVEGTDSYAFQGPIMTRLSATQLWDSLMVLKNEDLDKGFRLAPVIDMKMQLYARVKDMNADQIMNLVPQTLGNRYKYMQTLGVMPNANGKSEPMASRMNTMQAPKPSKKTTANKPKGKSYLQRKTDATSGGGMNNMNGMGMNGMGGMNNMNGMGMNGMNSMNGMGGMNGSTAGANPKVDRYGRASYFPVPQRTGHFLREFGQSERLLMDSDSTEASVPQVLVIMNGLVEEIAQDKKASIVKNTEAQKDDTGKIRTAYEMIMSRNAMPYEISQFRVMLKSNGGKFRDVIWVLLNSNEFKFRK